MTPYLTDTLSIETKARALRAAYTKALFARLFARLRGGEAASAHARV